MSEQLVVKMGLKKILKSTILCSEINKLVFFWQYVRKHNIWNAHWIVGRKQATAWLWTISSAIFIGLISRICRRELMAEEHSTTLPEYLLVHNNQQSKLFVVQTSLEIAKLQNYWGSRGSGYAKRISEDQRWILNKKSCGREVILIRQQEQVLILSSKLRLWPTSQKILWIISSRSWDICIYAL